MSQHFHANGKLLITGEYLVMEGAKALAVPLKLGQQMEVKPGKTGSLKWTALHPDGLWFEAEYLLPSLELTQFTDEKLATRLKQILQSARTLSADFLSDTKGFQVATHLDFNPAYGFGSSSTLIANLASWAKLDAFELQKLSFGGSGYDIACASATAPLVYALIQGQAFAIDAAFLPAFSEYLYFVYLGRKQQSSKSIHEFREQASFTQEHIQEVNAITTAMIQCQKQDDFEQLMHAHELLLSKVLKKPRVQELLFPDFQGAVKSLGAWGGDFVLVSSRLDADEFKAQMNRYGFDTFYSYDSLVQSA